MNIANIKTNELLVEKLTKQLKCGWRKALPADNVTEGD